MKSDIQYVLDAQGNRTGVILPQKEYEAFVEYMEDRRLAAEARVALADEERIPWEEVQADLIAQGKSDA